MSKIIKYIIYNLSLIVFLIIGVYTFFANDKMYLKEEVEKINKNESQYIVGSQRNQLDKILIEYEIKNNENDNSIIVMRNETNQIIGKSNLVQNAKEVYIDFEKIKESEYKNYILEIQNSNNIEITSITLYYYESLYVIIFLATTIFLTIVAVLLQFIIFKKNIKIENYYLIIASIVYGSFIILCPLFTSHDEFYHWGRAYEITEGHLLSDIKNNQALTELPEGVVGVYTKNFEEITYRTTVGSLKVKIDNAIRADFNMKTVAIYSPIQYLPQSIGIFIAKIFTNSPLIMAYVGRIVNAIVSMLIIYAAIKIIPFGKKILFIISFLPIAVEGFTSLSADAITISISLLLIAYILNLSYNKNINKVTKKDFFLLLIIFSILALCKIVYIPMILLCLLIPKAKFENKKKQITFLALIAIITVGLNLAWLKIASNYLALYDDAASQVTSILYHPFRYIGIMVYSFCQNFDIYLFSMIGKDLGWGELVKLVSIIPFAYIVLLSISALSDKDLKNKFKLKENIIFTLISLTILGLIFTSLYVQWNATNTTIIKGVQGRYFIPFLPLVLLLLSNIKISHQRKIDVDKLVLSAIAVLSYGTLLTLVVHFI